MHRFYIAPENWNPDALVLREGEAHHARDVLRLKQGDKVVVFNGQGREITGEIVPPSPLASPARTSGAAGDLRRDEIRLRKLHQAETPPLKCRITLGQAIPKGKNMDLIVQKAVEIGASEIAPLISERTIVDLDPAEAAQKQIKWQQVAIEAAKQCGQNWLPRVHTPRKLKNFFANDSVAAVSDRRTDESSGAQRAPLQLRLIGSLQSDAQHLKKILADYASEHRHLPATLLMLIGPEGDFTPAELALAKSHGCRPITLGPIILRVETAAIYCLSVLSYELL
jgi:16S rRNA (uracil1498-N3)-methyltransferase